MNGPFGRLTEFHYCGNAGSMTNAADSTPCYGLCPQFLFHSFTACRLMYGHGDLKVISLNIYFTVLFISIFDVFRMHMHKDMERERERWITSMLCV